MLQFSINSTKIVSIVRLCMLLCIFNGLILLTSTRVLCLISKRGHVKILNWINGFYHLILWLSQRFIRLLHLFGYRTIWHGSEWNRLMCPQVCLVSHIMSPLTDIYNFKMIGLFTLLKRKKNMKGFILKLLPFRKTLNRRTNGKIITPDRIDFHRLKWNRITKEIERENKR